MTGFASIAVGCVIEKASSVCWAAWRVGVLVVQVEARILPERSLCVQVHSEPSLVKPVRNLLQSSTGHIGHPAVLRRNSSRKGWRDLKSCQYIRGGDNWCEREFSSWRIVVADVEQEEVALRR